MLFLFLFFFFYWLDNAIKMANKILQLQLFKSLTHKQLEIYGFILSTVATDALVQQHQAISIHSAD